MTSISGCRLRTTTMVVYRASFEVNHVFSASQANEMAKTAFSRQPNGPFDIEIWNSYTNLSSRAESNVLPPWTQIRNDQIKELYLMSIHPTSVVLCIAHNSEYAYEYMSFSSQEKRDDVVELLAALNHYESQDLLVQDAKLQKSDSVYKKYRAGPLEAGTSFYGDPSIYREMAGEVEPFLFFMVSLLSHPKLGPSSNLDHIELTEVIRSLERKQDQLCNYEMRLFPNHFTLDPLEHAPLLGSRIIKFPNIVTAIVFVETLESPVMLLRIFNKGVYHMAIQFKSLLDLNNFQNLMDQAKRMPKENATFNGQLPSNALTN
ncbi:unnamed protein product [Protopolystoma xenopodis]|uniref:Uncharacterized protein n=1 Tax=Protopolystoma xenopodis TaxID=117903 RepID=A0A3S5CSH6_9PLAT|nr:unnamed protein product [Protopolystoma xenopodis]